MTKKMVGGLNNKNDPIEAIKEIKIPLFYYSVLIIVYTFSLVYIFKNDTQYNLFICLLILTVFGIIFITRDLFKIDLLYKCFFELKDSSGEKICKEVSGSLFLKIFITSLILGMIMQFISLSIILSVFDYGRIKQGRNINDYTVKKMSEINNTILFNYKHFLIASSVIIIVLGFFIGFAYGVKIVESDQIYSKIMRNIGCTLLSLALLGITSYEIYLSTEFFKVKKHKNSLYVS